MSRSSVIALAAREPAYELPDDAWTEVEGTVGVLDLTADADLIGAGPRGGAGLRGLRRLG